MLNRLKAETRELLRLCERSKKVERSRILKKSPAQKIPIEVHRFYCQKVAMDIEFLVPQPKPFWRENIPDSTILKTHTTYRYTSEPWLSAPTKSEKKFAMELESIALTFPSITDRPTILAMAAWFSVLCKVDDLTEKMEPKAAKQALQDARNIIGKDSGTSLGIETNWTQEEPAPGEMIRHILREFYVYTHNLLTPAIHTAFLEEIKKIFFWMMTETVFQETPPPSVDAYMRIRSGTIAISPFFTLVDGCLNKASIRPPPSPELIELKGVLNKVVGLQNDLIGLDKDIQTGWPMNIIVVLGGLSLKVPDSPAQEAQVMKECVRKAEKMHDEAVRRAIECWEIIQKESKTECERELSDVMMVFIGRFLKWSMASKRYKSG